MAMQTIETTDLFKGAYLLCSGGILYDIKFRRNSRQTASFVFEGHSLDKADNEYVTGKAIVNPLQYRETLNRLRDILFEKLNRNGPASHSYADTSKLKRRSRNDRKRNKKHRTYYR